MKGITCRRMIPAILILCLACVLSGCWNRRELNTLGIVGMVALDKSDHNFKITAEIIRPQKGEGGMNEPPANYVQATGQTLFDAYRNVTLKFDRRLFFPHIRVYIFSEEVARTGLANYIDLIFRDHEVRLDTPLFIGQGASAADLTGLAAGVSDVPSEYLEHLWREQKYNGKSVNMTVLDFLKACTAPGKNPVVGVIRKVRRHKVSEQDKEYELTTEGAAVFVKDRLAGFLDGNETRGYNWIAGKETNWLVVAPDPSGQGNIVIEVIKITRKKDVEISGGSVKIRVKTVIHGRIGEETGSVDFEDPAMTRMCEQTIMQVVKAEEEHTLAKVQQDYRSDIFGFGQVVHRKYPEEWEKMKDDWDEVFAGAETTVVVEAIINQSGKSNHSVTK